MGPLATILIAFCGSIQVSAARNETAVNDPEAREVDRGRVENFGPRRSLRASSPLAGEMRDGPLRRWVLLLAQITACLARRSLEEAVLAAFHATQVDFVGRINFIAFRPGVGRAECEAGGGVHDRLRLTIRYRAKRRSVSGWTCHIESACSAWLADDDLREPHLLPSLGLLGAS
jgi:hypothetical protein